MVTITRFRELALAFPKTEEAPHFHKASFRIIKGKIFATLDEARAQASVKLSLADQYVYCTAAKNTVHPVLNAWGRQGWTVIQLDSIDENLLKEIIEKAYEEVTNKK